MHVSSSETLDHLVRGIYAFGAVNREVQRRAVPEYPPACLQALAVLARTDAERVSEIADLLRIDLSVASRQVAVLEAAGWVERAPDPDDRRAQKLDVTDAGRATLDAAHARMVAAYEGVLTDWSDDDLATLSDLLARVRDDFARLAEPALAGAGR
jgi:DNA-binding MarR family transcriptional regulator